MPTSKITCSLEQQWHHWSSQGDVIENVWNDTLLTPADATVAELRQIRTKNDSSFKVSRNMVVNAKNRMKSHRAPGIDGIPAEVHKKVDCVTDFAMLLFSVMIKFLVYPKHWGTALIRSLLKPGKPADNPTSLRGIRLICSMASWFGQCLDHYSRSVWSAGYEQFGFRPGCGCMEAVTVLMVLIQSRISQKNDCLLLGLICGQHFHH